MSPNTGKSGAKLESLALFIKSLKGDVAGEKWSIKSKAPYKDYVRLILQRCLHMSTYVYICVHIGRETQDSM